LNDKKLKLEDDQKYLKKMREHLENEKKNLGAINLFNNGKNKE
jgi:hypothetical protein